VDNAQNWDSYKMQSLYKYVYRLNNVIMSSLNATLDSESLLYFCNIIANFVHRNLGNINLNFTREVETELNEENLIFNSC
jgi:hypothetical protein